MSDAANDSPKPLQVSLLMPLDVGKLTDGAPVLAKSLVTWREGECSIVPGGVVSGHLAHVQRKSPQDRTSRVEVVFDTADCSGRSMPVALTLYAVIVIREEAPSTTLGDSGLAASASIQWAGRRIGRRSNGGNGHSQCDLRHCSIRSSGSGQAAPRC